MATKADKALTRHQDLLYKRSLEKLQAGQSLAKDELEEVERRKEAEEDSANNHVFENLTTASTVTGLPREILQAAKGAGCPNFLNTRIYESIEIDGTVINLQDWVRDHAEEIKETAAKGGGGRAELVQEQIRKLRLLNDETEGQLVLRSAVMRAISEFAQGIRPILEQKLINELPPMLTGHDVQEIRATIRGEVDKMLIEVQKFEGVFAI